MATVAAEPQNMVALRRANEIRLGRAQLKREIRRGSASVEGVILSPPEVAMTMTIQELLTAQKRWGDLRAAQFLSVLGMPETKTIGSLTERQRKLLATQLEEPANGDRLLLMGRVEGYLRNAGRRGLLSSELASEMGYRSVEIVGVLMSLQARGRARSVPGGSHRAPRRWFPPVP